MTSRRGHQFDAYWAREITNAVCSDAYNSAPQELRDAYVDAVLHVTETTRFFGILDNITTTMTDEMVWL